MPANESGSRGSVQSIDRAIDILETLSSAPQGMALSDLAAETKLHISTVHRLITSLIERGYARKDPNTGKYRLTLRMFEIGSRVSKVFDLLNISQHFLEELACFTGEVVHLVERDGDSVVYLYKLEPYLHSLNAASFVGCSNPMYCVGVGKAILSLLPEQEVEAIWSRTRLESFTDSTITDLAAMKQELALTRERGYAIDNEEHEPGVHCVAAAIRNWEGSPVGAISVSAPTTRMNDEIAVRNSTKLIEITDEISRLLGWTQP